MLSRRSAFDATPNRLAAALEERRAAGQAVLDLTVSNPAAACIPYPEPAIRAALDDPRALGYQPDPFGIEPARRAVAELLARSACPVDPARIVLTAGTSEAYRFLFDLLCDPGDEVLVPQPSYPLLEPLARLGGVRLAPYRLAYDGAWHVDLDSLGRARTPRSRAVILVSPNNPTGSFVKRDELARIAALGLPIVSDEVFADYPFGDDARRARSALQASDTLVFALGGLSKHAALPGLKLAWIAAGGPRQPLGEALRRLEHIADAHLSVGTPVQLALPTLLATADLARDAIRARTARNLGALRARVAGSAATVLQVEGGWYAVVRLPQVRSEEAWVLDLLQQDGVLVQPGWFYDFAEEPILVLSLLTPEADFDEGVERLVGRVGRVS